MTAKKFVVILAPDKDVTVVCIDVDQDVSAIKHSGPGSRTLYEQDVPSTSCPKNDAARDAMFALEDAIDGETPLRELLSVTYLNGIRLGVLLQKEGTMITVPQ